MKSLTFTLIFTSLNLITLTSQTLVNYPKGSTIANVVAANISVTNISAESGITPVSCTWISAEGFNQTSWQNALSNGDYWVTTITPDNGYELNISNITIRDAGSNKTNPEPFAKRTLLYKTGSGGSWTYIAQYNSTHLGTNICNSNSSGLSKDVNINTTNSISIALAYFANTTTPFQARLGQFTVTGNTTLPVELVTFEGVVLNNEISLSWRTASELNNAGFEVRKSKDGKEWQIIDFIEGQGTSLELNRYEYLDKNPFSGTNYYRLKQTDFDDNYTYSKVISININKENQIQVFPNPTNGKLNISSPHLKKAKIEALNTMGEIVKTIQWEGEDIDISMLSAGLYYLAIYTDKGVVRKTVVKE